MACHHNHGASYPERNLAPGKKWIKSLTRSRLDTFVTGFFSDVNLYSVLFTHRIDGTDHVKMQVWSAPGLTKPSFQEAMKQTFREARKGESFGPSWTNHWFKVNLKIPSDWKKYERVQLEFDPDCEAMIFTKDGTPLQGITGGGGGDRRVEFIIPPDARKEGELDIVIESSCNGMFGVPPGDIIKPPEMNRYFQLKSADLVVPNQDAWNLMLDFETLKQIIDTLPGNTALQNKALVTANEIMNVFNNRDLSSIPKARKLAEEVFGEAWESKGTDIYKEGPQDASIWGIGYCHIDTAWLWPYRVTQQKVARSWSTQVDLMDRYPEHRFMCSQAQQYKWLEQLYPPLFERVKEKVLAGKFQPVGGAWVENDANMPSGEALARQFILGQRYFESRFGIRCETALLPDSFGLTGALPQLIRLSGMKYFFTQKLSWNNINVFPHSTFNWVGIDGTQVLCHMTPVDTYTAQATVGDINKGLTNHKNLESNSTALLVFGNGDGGGGPLPKMLDNLRRIRAAGNQSRDLPTVVMGRSIEDFFKDVDKKSNAGDILPNWHGELYLEFHRGTYTSHGSIKKGNRKSEILLRDVEHVATMASIFKKDEYSYPYESINENWEKVLLNQFHDVLPGSAIGMVYDDAEQLYAEVRKSGFELMEEAFGVLTPGSLPLHLNSLSKLTRASVLFGYNTTFFPRLDLVKIPLTGSAKALGGSVLQTSKDGSEGYALFDCSQGGRLASLTEISANATTVKVSTKSPDHFVLENKAVKMVCEDGRITSLFDVALGRELVPKGKTGGLIIFDDRPNYWDAWDVEIHHLEKFQELKFTKAKIIAEGPVRASVQTEVKYGQSTILITISLDAIPATLAPGSRNMFTFDAEVDWHQRHEFLKFEIPLTIHSDVATYETPFGWVQRPTHKNTTWDIAKFEVCGHKYADLSEYGYGVAILSESKYGFSCRGNVLRISLLRAATAPDAEQDQGKHQFSWAVLPHEGHFIQSDVAVAAYLFNSPVHVRFMPNGEFPMPPPGAPPSTFYVTGAPNVFLETIKRGDLDEVKDAKGKRTVVLRLYEALGGHAHADVHVHALNVSVAYTTNLLEDDADAEQLELARPASGDTTMRLHFHGFEVKTVKLVLDE